MVDHGGDRSFRLSGNEMLSEKSLGTWLNTLQTGADSPDAAIIYDACNSDSFKHVLRPSDDGRIERVWAVIRPPQYGTIPSGNPVLNLPTVDLLPTGAPGEYKAEQLSALLIPRLMLSTFFD